MPEVQENDAVRVTISDAYHRPLAQLSSQLGRRQYFSEFRNIGMTEEGITFMALDGRILEHNPRSAHRFGGPRLIVKTRSNRKFTYTYANQEAVPGVGQPYLDDNHNLAFGVAGMTKVYPIMRMQVEEVA